MRSAAAVGGGRQDASARGTSKPAIAEDLPESIIGLLAPAAVSADAGQVDGGIPHRVSPRTRATGLAARSREGPSPPVRARLLCERQEFVYP